MKKIIISILALCLVVCNMNLVQAKPNKEFQRKYLDTYNVDRDEMVTYPVIENKGSLYISISTIAEILGYKEITIKQDGDYFDCELIKDGNYYSVINYSGVDHQIWIGRNKYDISDPIYTENELFFKIDEIMNVLRIKVTVSNESGNENRIIVDAPTHTIYDFLYQYYKDIKDMGVKQSYILDTGHTGAGDAIGKYTSIVLKDFLNDMDIRFLVPFIGNESLTKEDLENTMLYLNQEDKIFLTDKGIKDASENIKVDMLNGFSFDEMTNLVGVLGYEASLPQVIRDLVLANAGKKVSNEKLITEIMNIKNLDKSTMSSVCKAIKGLDQFSKVTESIGHAKTIYDLVNREYNLLFRSKEWTDLYVKNLELINDVDPGHFPKKESSFIKKAKEVSNDLLNEKEHTYEAMFDDLMEQVHLIVADEATKKIPNNYVNYYYDTLKLVSETLKYNKNYKDWVEEGSMGVIVNNMLKLSEMQKFEIDYSECLLLAKDGMSLSTVQRIKDELALYLKMNLRGWCGLYFLKSDSEWDKTPESELVKNNILNFYNMIISLNLSESDNTQLFSDEKLNDLTNEDYNKLSYKTDYEIIDDKVPDFDQTPVQYYGKGYLVKVDGQYGFIDNDKNYEFEPKYSNINFDAIRNYLVIYENLGNTGIEIETHKPVEAWGLGGVVAGVNGFDRKTKQKYAIIRMLEDDEKSKYEKLDTFNRSQTIYAFDKSNKPSPEVADTFRDAKEYYIYVKESNTIYGPYSKNEVPSFSLQKFGNGFFCFTGIGPNSTLCGLFYEKTNTGKYIIHSKDDKYKSDIEFDKVEFLSNDSAKVYMGDEIGIVNNKCELVVKGKYEDISEPIAGRSYIKVNGKWILAQVLTYTEAEIAEIAENLIDEAEEFEHYVAKADIYNETQYDMNVGSGLVLTKWKNAKKHLETLIYDNCTGPDQYKIAKIKEKLEEETKKKVEETEDKWEGGTVSGMMQGYSESGMIQKLMEEIIKYLKEI